MCRHKHTNGRKRRADLRWVMAKPLSHLGDGRGFEGACGGAVLEGGMPTGSEPGGVGFQVACLGMEKLGLTGPDYLAEAKVRVDEGPPDEIGAIYGGVGLRCCGVWGYGYQRGVFEGK